jgi:hypothetical protein
MLLLVLLVLAAYLRGKNQLRNRDSRSAGPNTPNGVAASSTPLEGPSSPSTPFSALRGRLGRTSRVAAAGLMILSILLLVFSVVVSSLIVEIDSVVSFLAALVLLFREPSARISARAYDALLLSANRSLSELSLRNDLVYVPLGKTVNDVVVMSEHEKSTPTDGNPAAPILRITPPGRDLANVFMRESGLPRLTVEGLTATLPGVLCRDFALASSVRLSIGSDSVEATLEGAKDCGCDLVSGEVKGGTLGCMVGSLLAVLYSSATERKVVLERCRRGPENGQLKVTMRLGSIPLTGVS